MRRASLACALLAACTGEPDVVAHSLSDSPTGDGGGMLVDSGAPIGPPFVAMPDASALDAGPCDFDQALRNANLPPELLLVAVTCSVPLSWWGQGITGIDWLQILEVLLGGMSLPPGEAREVDACDLMGVYYYPDPVNPDNVKLCPSICIPLQNRVVANSGKVGCTRSVLPDEDAGGP